MRRLLVTRHGSPQDMVLAEAPSPEPGAGEVVVGVHAAGVNFPDLLTVAGTYQNLPPLPFSPGKEVAGEILALGPGVEGFAIGDRVIAQLENGGYAEEVAVEAQRCWPLPAGIAMTEAAGLGLTYVTAWFGIVDRGGFRPGDVVLVSGAAGGCGTAALQITEALGGHAIGLVGSPEKADFLRSLGVRDVIVGDGPDLRDRLKKEVSAMTGGHGADIVFDPVGGDVLDAGLRALAWAGRAVVVGFAGGGPTLIRSNYLLIKHISVHGLHVSDYRDFQPAVFADAVRRILDLAGRGRLRPPIHAVHDLGDPGPALAHLSERRALGKVVLITERGRRAQTNRSPATVTIPG